jgi:alpha,alpha-trehalose-phosphate synthase [UDP-forming]
MRLSFRLICSLVVVLTLVSFLFSYVQVRADKERRRNELRKHTQELAERLQDSVQLALEKASRPDLRRIVERPGELEGIAIYDRTGAAIAVTSSLATHFPSVSFLPAAPAGATGPREVSADEFRRLNGRSLYIYAIPLSFRDNLIGTLAAVHDAGYINTQGRDFLRGTFVRVLVEVFVIALTVLLIISWTISWPIARTLQWMRALRMGKASARPSGDDQDLFTPLRREFSTLVESLAAARESAEKEARLREAGESTWTAERLSVHVRGKLDSSRLFVVSNREPYMHVKEGKAPKVVVPASGLVTALEPILRACDGTWIAHGSGDADRQNVDRHDRLPVPPEEPKYTLRRVWLNKNEEEGYYYGFSNEGLWPLCHIAHTRPIFRSSDWDHYQQVNEKFAKAVLQEMSGTEHPVLLIQDYHFALLPRLIKKERPDARIAIFWHIPWPNPEAFAICPWQRELLEGLLGADLIGFHIQAHCDNFLETVNRGLESRVEWDQFAVNRDSHLTLVRPFPISVAPANGTAEAADFRSANALRETLFKELGVEALYLGVGVDRVDYTKGILERFLAIERFLEKYPRYHGKFSFAQIGAPSRTHIKRYHDFLAEVEAEAERINWRFRTERWKPILFLKRHHSHEEIAKFYRAADICMVTSLHDGMNLVAKEFVAARNDEDGVLTLSRFAGACRELRDALVVNPYDTDEMAEAIHFALEMDPAERRARMRRMRQTVKEQNIYRWAGNLIAELCEVRLEDVKKRSARAANPTSVA